MSDRFLTCGRRRRSASPRLDTQSARPRPLLALADASLEAGTPPVLATADAPTHVEQLACFVNEGHLYRHGDQHFLVYTGASGGAWDACATVQDPFGHWTFGQLLARGADRAEALVELCAWIERAGTGQDGERGRAPTGGP